MKYAVRTGTYIWGFFPVIYEGIIPYIKYFLKLWIQIYQIWKFIKGKKYDLCVLNVSVLLWPLLYLSFKGNKIIVFVRETIEPKFARKWLYRILSRFGDYFIAVSKSIENDFISITYNTQIDTLYSSVETFPIPIESGRKFESYFNLSVLLKVYSKDKIKLLTLGGISKRKNQQLILDALIQLREMNVELPIIFIAGKIEVSNTYSIDFIKYIENNRLKENCIVLNELPRAVVLKLMALVDSIIISSLSEGMPLAVAESFMLGKAVISTKVGGIPEVVIDDYNGILVETDANSLAEGMLKFMSRDPEDRSFTENALKSHSEYFDLKRNMKRLKDIFEELI